MRANEFHQKYADTPLGKRFVVLSFNELGMKTLRDIYLEVKAIEDEIRPAIIRKEKLIEIAEKYLV